MNQLKRAILINDISGFGKCALGIAIPVVSACGVEVCTMPTAVLSTNTSFANFKMVDLTNSCNDYLNHWKEIGLKADVLYAGFFASAEQIELVSSNMRYFTNNIVIDPIMGDNGKLYRTFQNNPSLIRAIKELAFNADVLLPNLTEACTLADLPYPTTVTVDFVYKLGEMLLNKGARAVVLKGIENNGRLYNFIFENSGCAELPFKLLPFKLFGTGDLFASVLTGKLASGRYSLLECVDKAGKFVIKTMEQTILFEDYKKRGLCFEKIMGELLDG